MNIEDLQEKEERMSTVIFYLSVFLSPMLRIAIQERPYKLQTS